MLKFFRKYNKYILAVGGTLLLITFLIDFSFTGLMKGIGQGSVEWATVGPSQQKVTLGDLHKLQRELQLLQVIQGQMGRLPTPEKLDRAEYWYLLVREAEEAGLIAAAAPDTVGFAPKDVDALRAMTGEPEAFVL